MKTIRLLLLAMMTSMLLIFSGCEKDEDNDETLVSPLEGTWSDGNMRFVITEDTITQQNYRGDDGWMTIMQGSYEYNSVNKSITTNITKTYITENSGVVDLPYTDTTMGVTWTEMTKVESVAIEEQDSQTVMMFQAYFGGNTSTLVGDWSTIYDMNVTMVIGGETDVVNADMSTSLVVDETTMTITVNEFNPENGTSIIITESAYWTKDSNSITLTGGENNQYLENGVFDYKIIDSGLIMAQQGPGSELIYMVKQE